MSKLRFGLIGTGRIGQLHADNILANPDLELTYVADPVSPLAPELAEKYGAKFTKDGNELINSGEIDAVLIASSTPTHVGFIEAAVDAGVPALCEKPIDLDITKVDAIREKVAKSSTPVALGFNRRMDPAFFTTHQRVEKGDIGKLEQLSIISRDPAAPPADYVATSGGIFRDMTIHDFDMARFFLPDITEVTAIGVQAFDEGARLHNDFDTVVVAMKSASGATVSITNSRRSVTGYDQRLEAFGSEGSLSVANNTGSLVTFSDAHGTNTGSPYLNFFLERYNDAYKLELAEFVKLIRGEESICSTFEDGRSALVLADAATRSAAEGVTVKVDLTA